MSLAKIQDIFYANKFPRLHRVEVDNDAVYISSAPL